MSGVVLTGAGSGIGAATRRRRATQGIDLVIHTGSRHEAADAVASQYAAVRTAVVVGDMAEASTIDTLIRAAIALGGLRGVVVNAGFADNTSLAELDDEKLELSLRTIVVSLADLLRKSIPLLKDSGQGRFVAVSSFVVHRITLGASTFPATAAAKAGVEALVKAAAAKNASRGITIQARRQDLRRHRLVERPARDQDLSQRADHPPRKVGRRRRRPPRPTWTSEKRATASGSSTSTSGSGRRVPAVR